VWARTLDTNARGVYISIQLAAAAMASRGGGRIVIVGSTNAFWMESTLAAYNASKAAAVAVMRTAAMEFAADGITVNGVAPGLIETDMTQALTSDTARASSYLRQIPLGRFGTTEDVARAVAFLVLPETDWITGHLLVVDGGQTIGTTFP
jgi:NAD(P)-dependent dehydrogenase (short-subunit alcohol dehydrogenase family)